MKSTTDLKLELKAKIRTYHKESGIYKPQIALNYWKSGDTGVKGIPESQIKGHFVLMGYDVKEVDRAWGNAVSELVDEYAKLMPM